jgi:hypothetical protein
METLTIKLLHERRSNNVRRKVDGYSGKLYVFLWSNEHKAYVYTTSEQEEADDLFNSQGRSMGSYFAPVITLRPKAEPKPIADSVVLALLDRELDLPKLVDADVDRETVALAVLAAYDKGFLKRQALEHPPRPVAEVTAPVSETATVSAVTGPTVEVPSPAVESKPEPVAVAPAKAPRKARVQPAAAPAVEV